MSRFDQMQIAQQAQFQQRVAAAAVHYSLNTVLIEAVVDQQTITGTATGGTGTITVNGQVTAALQFNASAAAIQAALSALSTVGSVECTGGPLGTNPVVINFNGPLVNGDQSVATLGTGSLTGGTWTVAHTTVGTWVAQHAKRAALASKIVQNPTLYGQLMAIGVADNLAVQNDFPAVNGYGVPASSPGNVQNGTLTSGQPTVTGLATGTAALVPNQPVSGTGIPGGTVILSIQSATALTLSQNATANGAQSLTFAAFTQTEAQITVDIDVQMGIMFNAYI